MYFYVFFNELQRELTVGYDTLQNFTSIRKFIVYLLLYFNFLYI